MTDDRHDIPAENGRPAGFDPASGEVHGSGSGAGGGESGEDFDNDPASGDAYPQTGGEGTEHVPGAKGPPHVAE